MFLIISFLDRHIVETVDAPDRVLVIVDVIVVVIAAGIVAVTEAAIAVVRENDLVQGNDCHSQYLLTLLLSDLALHKNVIVRDRRAALAHEAVLAVVLLLHATRFSNLRNSFRNVICNSNSLEESRINDK